MMKARTLLWFWWAGLAVVTGCAASGEGELATGGDEELESDPGEVGQVSEELAGSVDCRERADTAYTNGQPSRISVITIGGKAVAKPAGHAFLKMQAAARAEAGITMSLTSGFRTMDEQRYLYNCYLSKRCNNGNLAARPGYSNHQNGKAIDVTTSTWLARNGGRFGFVRTVPSEPWHWEYDGADPGGPCSGSAYPVAMRFESPKDGGWYQNGIWMKIATPDARIAKVTYWAGSYNLGGSTDAAGQFAMRYTFNVLGSRSVTAMGFDSAGKQVAEQTVTFRVEP